MRRPRKYEGQGWLIETFGHGEIAVPDIDVDIESDFDEIHEYSDGYEEARSAFEDIEVIDDDVEINRIKRVEGVFLCLKISGEWTPWVFGEDELYAIERLEDEYGEY